MIPFHNNPDGTLCGQNRKADGVGKMSFASISMREL
jgi:hypothetical protein